MASISYVKISIISIYYKLLIVISWNKTRNPDKITWNVSGKHGINFLVHGFVQKLESYFICRHTKHASLASTVNILFVFNI